MGFIAVMRSDVSLIVLGIGSIIIGIAVNYPLHFIAHTDHGGTAREVLKEMVSPLLIGNVRPEDEIHKAEQKSWIDGQLSLF